MADNDANAGSSLDFVFHDIRAVLPSPAALASNITWRHLCSKIRELTTRDSVTGEKEPYGILPARSQDIHRIRTVTPVEGANLQQYERRSQVSQRDRGEVTMIADDGQAEEKSGPWGLEQQKE